MTKQTKITIQTDSLLLFRGRNSTRVHCPVCDAESEMVEMENLQVISNLDREELERWMNSIHHLRMPGNGALLVCLNCILASIRNPSIF